MDSDRAPPTIDIERQRAIKTSEDNKTTFPEMCLLFVSYVFLLLTFPLSLFFCIRILNEYHRAVVFRLGRLRKNNPMGPGIVFYLPCIESLTTVDLRVQSFDVPPQEVITKDAVTVMVDAIIYYRIVSPIDTIVQVSDVVGSTQFIAQTTLRNVVGTKLLSEILTMKGKLSKMVAEVLDEITLGWGVKVQRVEIRDIVLPESMQRSMAAEAEAICEARAKIVTAEGELSSSKALREASDIMASNPITLQLRYLQTLSIISSDTNSTVIFPFPMELMELGSSGQSGSSRAK